MLFINALIWLGWAKLDSVVWWPLLCAATVVIVYLSCVALTSLLARTALAVPLTGRPRQPWATLLPRRMASPARDTTVHGPSMTAAEKSVFVGGLRKAAAAPVRGACTTTIFWPRAGVRKPGGRARGVTARGMACSAWAQMVADVAREINADAPYSRSAESTASSIPLRATRHAGIAASITR
jgi:hypothetical protein